MKIGILQTGHLPDPLQQMQGDYDALFRDMLAGHGFTFETFNVVDMEFPSGPDAADGWLITGSKHGVYEDHPWIPLLETLIREIHQRHIPLIGVCFGHQIIAQALGGKVEKFAGGWAVGRTEYDFNGEPLALNAWHQDQVTRKPAAARTLAANGFCDHAALAYGDTIWTVQAHPEFGARHIDGLIEHRAPGVVPQHLLDQAASDLDQPTANTRIAELMAGFFLKERVA